MQDMFTPHLPDASRVEQTEKRSIESSTKPDPNSSILYRYYYDPLINSEAKSGRRHGGDNGTAFSSGAHHLLTADLMMPLFVFSPENKKVHQEKTKSCIVRSLAKAGGVYLSDASGR